jgi:hypothetical protein
MPYNAICKRLFLAVTRPPMFGMDQPLFKNLNEIRLREHAMIFMNPNASQDEIVKSGHCIFIWQHHL